MAKKPLGIVIFCFGLFLFNWPILTIAGRASPLLSYLYLFIAWALIILLAFLLPNHAKPRPPNRTLNPGEVNL